jgi:hypothetical protein
VTDIVKELVPKTGDKNLWVGSMALTESESRMINFKKAEADEVRVLILKCLVAVGN